MAAWQFDLFLIPEGEPMPTTSEDGLDIPGIPAKLSLDIQKVWCNVLANPGLCWKIGSCTALRMGRGST